MAKKATQQTSTAGGELFKAEKVCYVDGAGNSVPAGTPGARREVVYSRNWYVRLKGPDGTWKKHPLSPDKAVAQKMAVQLREQVEKKRHGLVDPAEETMTSPLGEWLDAFTKNLRLEGGTEKYVSQTRREVVRVAWFCRYGSLKGYDLRAPDADTRAAHLLASVTLAEITVDKLDAFLASKESGPSPTTKNRYRRAVVGLANYLVGKRKLTHNPFAPVTRAKGKKVRERRALLPADLQKLLDAARVRPVAAARASAAARWGDRAKPADLSPEYRARLERDGRQRALVYLTAALTGLRYGTLGQVTVSEVRLVPGHEAWDIPGEKLKSGRHYRAALRSDLAAALRAWVEQEGKGRGDRVFDLPASSIVKELRKDLRAAGIPYRDERGRVFDFHALRKCCATYLRRASVDPAVAMKVLDHGDIRLTMQVYTDAEALDDRAAVEALPKFG